MDGQKADAREGCTAQEHGCLADRLVVLGAPSQWKVEVLGAPQGQGNP